MKPYLAITDAADDGPAACGYFPEAGWGDRFHKRTHEDVCSNCGDVIAAEIRKSLQKPTRASRRSIKVDTQALALAKPESARDGSYRVYVRSQPCALKGFNDHRCYGPIEAAHIGKTGLGRKSSDYTCISFCTKAHSIQTELGWGCFSENYNFNPFEVAFWLLEAWVRRTR